MRKLNARDRCGFAWFLPRQFKARPIRGYNAKPERQLALPQRGLAGQWEPSVRFWPVGRFTADGGAANLAQRRLDTNGVVPEPRGRLKVHREYSIGADEDRGVIDYGMDGQFSEAAFA